MANARKDYETLVIIKADLTDEEIENEVTKLTGFIEAEEGGINEKSDWGKKRLAYAIKKQRYGFYSLIRFSAGPDIVAKLYRNYRFNENILKGLVVIFDGSAGRNQNKTPFDEAEEKPKLENENVTTSETTTVPEAPVEQGVIENGDPE